MDIYRTGYSERWHRLKIKIAGDETSAQCSPQTRSLAGFAPWVTSCLQSGHRSPGILVFPLHIFCSVPLLPPHHPEATNPMELQTGTHKASAFSPLCGTPGVYIIHSDSKHSGDEGNASPSSSLEPSASILPPICQFITF